MFDEKSCQLRSDAFWGQIRCPWYFFFLLIISDVPKSLSLICCSSKDHHLEQLPLLQQPNKFLWTMVVGQMQTNENSSAEGVVL